MKRANGTGTIYKLKGKLRKPYRAMVTLGQDLDGKLMRKTLGTFATQKEAQSAVLAWASNPTMGNQKKITFGEVWQWAMDDRVRKGVVEERLQQLNMMYSKFKKLHDMEIKDIKLPHLQAIIDEYIGTLSPNTLKNMKAALSSTFTTGIKYDVITKNIAKNIEIPKVEKSDIHRALQYDEILWLWNNYKTSREAKYMLLLVYTGMRPGELISIKLEDVHLKDKYMIGGSKSDAGRNRIIPIHHAIAPIISELYASAKFARCDTLLGANYPSKTYSKSMNTYMKRAFPFSARAHDGRHTFATLMSQLRAPEHIIKRVMGHSLNDNITQFTYTHTQAIELIEEVNKLPTKEDIETILNTGNQEVATF